MNDDGKQAALPRGTVLQGANAYVIEDVLGIGGFGITYLATTEVTWVNGSTMRRRVAVKEHFFSEYSERAGDGATVRTADTGRIRQAVDGSLEDFLAEAARLHKLADGNANIVKVFDVFRANGTAYYVMEYLEGISLGAAIAGRPLDEANMLAVMKPVVGAVAFLHSQRINHLDIKPDNIVLVDGGSRPVLIDFGQSKHFRSDGSATSTVKVKGATAGYAPVEQYSGITEFSPAADVYALGATMMACLTGKTPPLATQWQAADKARAIDALPASAATKAVIDRALAADPSERYADAGALFAALPAANPTAVIGETMSARRSYKWLIIVVAAALIAAVAALLAAAGTYIVFRPEPTPLPAAAPTPLPTDTTAIAAEETAADDAANGASTDQERIERENRERAERERIERENRERAEQERIERENRERAERERIERENRERAEQERIERENQIWNSHRTPGNLYLVVRRGGNHYYFSESDWNSLSRSQRSECTRKGVVIDNDGQRFILALNEEPGEYTWYEAMSRFGNRLPTKEQAEAWMSQQDAVQRAVRAFGGNMLGPNDEAVCWYWTRTETSDEGAYDIGVCHGHMFTNEKVNVEKVRLVAPVSVASAI